MTGTQIATRKRRSKHLGLTLLNVIKLLYLLLPPPAAAVLILGFFHFYTGRLPLSSLSLCLLLSLKKPLKKPYKRDTRDTSIGTQLTHTDRKILSRQATDEHAFRRTVKDCLCS
jgi:hypothetical protein